MNAPSRSRHGCGIWIGVALIFVFGIVTGVLGSVFYVHHRVGRLHSRGPRAFEHVALELLDWRLDLDEAQEARIGEILGEVHVRLLDFKTEHSDEIDAIVDSGLTRIEETLNEDQRAEWAHLRARIEAAHRVPTQDHQGRHGH